MVLEQVRYHSLYSERIGGVGRSFLEQIQKKKCKIFYAQKDKNQFRYSSILP